MAYHNCPKCGSYNPPGTLTCDCGYPLNPRNYHQEKAQLRRDQAFFQLLKFLSFGLMIAGVVLFVVTFPFRKKWPKRNEFLPAMHMEPIQTQSNLPESFTVNKENVTYKIVPRFHYDLYGLVVSEHRSDSLTDVLHEKWNDFLNIKDICVVWGPNIDNEIYRLAKFSSGNFTCFCKWKSSEIGRRFVPTALSNNHLLSDDPKISSRILRAGIGDQIHIKGFLCRYENPAVGFSRDTSIVRSDTGNGACETIYVTDFEILKSVGFLPRLLFNVSWPLVLVGLVLFLSLAFLFPSQK